MKELIARLEGAKASQLRGLDGLIARDVLGWLPYFDLIGDRLLRWDKYAGHWHLPGDSCDGRHSVSDERNPEPPLFTSSIDAAMTLVPERWSYRVGENEPRTNAQAVLGRSYPTNMVITQEAHTPAIALCIAALKARSA